MSPTPTHTSPPTLLEQLSTPALHRFLLQCNTRQYTKDEQIVREMESDHHMYFIKHGHVKVTLFSRDGREVSFTELHSGECFGEISALDQKPRSADVIALTDTQMLVMSPSVLQEVLHYHPAFALALLHHLSAIVRRLGERIFEFSTSSVNNRIHAELLRLARANLELDGVARISNMPTHAQFATRVSCHREAVTRELKSLESRGILMRQKGITIVPNMDALIAMVEQVRGPGMYDPIFSMTRRRHSPHSPNSPSEISPLPMSSPSQRTIPADNSH